jgi:hypothetical protein
MYQLREESAGFYTITLPIPKGASQYLFFHRGEKIPDPTNPRKVYNLEGRVISEVVVP